MAHLDANPDITKEEITKALKRPSYFGYYGDIEEMFHTWSLGPIILTRDSGILEVSNNNALMRHLSSDESLENDWTITHSSHWGPGWVDHLSFKAIDESGGPTRIFRVITAWFNALSDYPVADESDYSEREYEALLDNIDMMGQPMVGDSPPENWASQCCVWFWDNDPGAVENNDDQGGCPSEEQMKTCLEALSLYVEEE